MVCVSTTRICCTKHPSHVNRNAYEGSRTSQDGPNGAFCQVQGLAPYGRNLAVLAHMRFASTLVVLATLTEGCWVQGLAPYGDNLAVLAHRSREVAERQAQSGDGGPGALANGHPPTILSGHGEMPEVNSGTNLT